MLRRSPTTFGVLLSFSSFAGLLTLLLLAQTTIPERGSLSGEPLPTDIVGPALVAPSQEPPSQTGTGVPDSSVLNVPGGPVIVAPVGGTGPSGQVEEPATPPGEEKKPGDQPDEGNQPNPPAGEPSPPAQPQPPAPEEPDEKPSGQPTSPPGVLPASAESEDDGDDGHESDDEDDTDTENSGAENHDKGNGGEKENEGKGSGKSNDKD